MKHKYGKMFPYPEFEKCFKGYTIKSVGITNDGTYNNGDPRTLEGGLTFILTDGKHEKKVILGYTELGEWIEHVEEIS